jgi:membrane protease YdiL (CAAX protease family)
MKDNEAIPNALKTNKWISIGKVLLFCLSCAITLATTSGLTKGLNNSWASEVSLLIAIVITIVLSLVFVRWEGGSLKTIRVIPVKYSLGRILLGFILGLLLASLQPLILLMTDHIKFEYSGLESYGLLINSFCLYLLVAFREEIAFRGYPLRSLNSAIGSWAGLLIIGIIFTAEHILGGMSIGQALIGPGVGSLLFGIAALSTKGLSFPIGLHFAWNFGQWIFGFKDNTGIWHAVVAKGYETQVEHTGYISYLIVMSLGILGFIFYWKKTGLRNTYLLYKN